MGQKNKKNLLSRFPRKKPAPMKMPVAPTIKASDLASTEVRSVFGPIVDAAAAEQQKEAMRKRVMNEVERELTRLLDEYRRQSVFAPTPTPVTPAMIQDAIDKLKAMTAPMPAPGIPMGAPGMAPGGKLNIPHLNNIKVETNPALPFALNATPVVCHDGHCTVNALLDSFDQINLVINVVMRHNDVSRTLRFPMISAALALSIYEERSRIEGHVMRELEILHHEEGERLWKELDLAALIAQDWYEERRTADEAFLTQENWDSVDDSAASRMEKVAELMAKPPRLNVRISELEQAYKRGMISFETLEQELMRMHVRVQKIDAEFIDAGEWDAAT